MRKFICLFFVLLQIVSCIFREVRFTWVSAVAGTHFGYEKTNEAEENIPETLTAETIAETEAVAVTYEIAVTTAVTTAQTAEMQAVAPTQLQTEPVTIAETAPQTTAAKNYSVFLLTVDNMSELSQKFVCGYKPQASDLAVTVVYICDTDPADMYSVKNASVSVKCPDVIQSGNNIFYITAGEYITQWVYNCDVVSEAERVIAEGVSAELSELEAEFYEEMNARRVTAGLSADVYSSILQSRAVKRAQAIAGEYKTTGTCTHTDSDGYSGGANEIIEWGLPISIYRNMGLQETAMMLTDNFADSPSHWTAWTWDYVSNDLDPDVRYSGAGIYYDADTGYIFVSVLMSYEEK